MKLRISLSILIVFAGGWACGGTSESKGPQDDKVVSVQTTVDVDTVAAGTDVAVECVALDAKGRTLEVTGFDLVLDPVTSGTSNELMMTPMVAGTLWVACKLANSDIVDPTPEEVQVVPGPVHGSFAEVIPPEITAGESSEVQCLIVDAYGNTIEPSSEQISLFSVVVEPSKDVSISGMSISTTVAGDYEVLCGVADVEALEAEGASWVVTPGRIVQLELRLDPDSAAYKINDKVAVLGVGEDQYGNVHEGVEITDVSIVPAEQHVIYGELGDNIRFTSEGFFTIEGKLTEDTSKSATIEVVVDQTPPTIIITSPERGLTTMGDTVVTVSGEVSDNLGTVTWLELNGSAVSFDEGAGSFSVEMPLSYGANMVWVRAGDPYGNERDVGRSVVWSSKFYPLNPPSLEDDKITAAMVIMFTQEAVDDGDHDHDHVDDLATIFEIIMGSLDLGSMLGGQTIGEFLGCSYEITNLAYDSPSVSLTLVPGGLEMRITINNFVAELWNHGNGFCTLNWDNWYSTGPVVNTADSITITTTISLSVVNGETVSEASDTTVEIENLHAGDLDFLGWLGGALTTFMEPLFADLIETQLEGQLGDIFNMLAFNQEFELPSPVDGQPPNKLSLQTEISGIQMEPAFLMLTLDGMSAAAEPMRPNPDILGSLAYEGCGSYGQPPTPPPTPLQIAMNDDLLNQLLFGLWDGGTLNLDLGAEALGDVDLSQYGISDLSIHIEPLLPLIFNSCKGDQDIIQIGDMFVDAEFKLLGQDAHMAFWIQGEAPVVIAIVENDEGALELGFELLDLDPIVLEVVLNEGLFEGDDASLVALMKEQLLPQMLGSLTGGLGGFTLPQIDLSGVSEGVPEGTGINFSFSNIGRQDAFLLMQGELN
jgi:hypothetical protein